MIGQRRARRGRPVVGGVAYHAVSDPPSTRWWVRRSPVPLHSPEIHLIGVTQLSKLDLSELEVSELSHSVRVPIHCAHLTRKDVCHMELLDK